MAPSSLPWDKVAILALQSGKSSTMTLLSLDLPVSMCSPHNFPAFLPISFFYTENVTLEMWPPTFLFPPPSSLSSSTLGIQAMRPLWCRGPGALCLRKSSPSAGMVFLNCVYLLAPWCESASHQLHINLVISLELNFPPAMLWLIYSFCIYCHLIFRLKGPLMEPPPHNVLRK